MSRPIITAIKGMGIAMLLVLGACQTPAPQVRIVTAEVPKDLRHCQDAPASPKGEITQKDVSSFVVKLGGAYRDCKDKLGSVDGLLTNFEQRQVKP